MAESAWRGRALFGAALLVVAGTVGIVTAATAARGVGATPQTAARSRFARSRVDAPRGPRFVVVTGSTCTNAGRLATWSDEHLAMLTIAVPAEETDPGAVDSEVSNGAGGVVLFGATAPSDLGSPLSTLEAKVPGGRGLLVMTDEEGGGIQRMANLVGSLPWPAQMGKDWSAAKIEKEVAAVGKKMAAAHVDMDLAPVVDVDGRNVPPSATDPDGWRSFSGDTSVVTRDGLAFAKGLQSSGVIPVLKHFPGLGGASGNTDDGPAHTLPWSELKKVALPPFEAGIAAGLPAIMVSNATVPGLASWPASLSPAAMHELVTTLGFHGLVVTDSLTAGAISGAGFSVPAAAAQAIRAGADMVMFSLGPNVKSETNSMASAIVAAVKDKTLARSRLVAAAGKVLAARHVDLCG